jgi:hypothetical protein
MRLCRICLRLAAILVCGLSLCLTAATQTTAPSSSPSSAKPSKKPAAPGDSGLDAGTVINGVYRNRTLAFSFKIPEAWVLRTEEMNAPEEDAVNSTNAAQPAASSAGAKVLLAAFSRPPAARAEDVNSSILVAAENAAAYPGLKAAEQYFGPLMEVAKSQGFTMDEDPYGIAVGTKTLVRGDFHKDVGSRVMHQSTLAMLAHGYAISITIIAGTDDEVEELIDALTFSPSGK